MICINAPLIAVVLIVNVLLQWFATWLDLLTYTWYTGGKKSPKITKALKLGLKNLNCSVLWELFFTYCAFSTVSGSPHHHGAEILTQYWKHCQGLSPVSPRLQFQGGQVLFSCMGCRTRDFYPSLELILFSSALNILQSQQVFGPILLNVENMWVSNLLCWALAFINKNLWFIHIAVQSVLTVFLFCTSDLYLWVMPEAFDKNIFCNIWENLTPMNYQAVQWISQGRIETLIIFSLLLQLQKEIEGWAWPKAEWN